MSIQRFAVEFDHRTVGIAVRVSGGFIFYSCQDEFAAMDGRIYPRARQLERQLEKLHRRDGRSASAARQRAH